MPPLSPDPVSPSASDLSPAARTSTRRAVVAGSIGNFTEWYDFTVYGFFASVLAQVFFPRDEPLVALLVTFAVFGTGFLMRPLGAVVFGHLGDRRGRRSVLMITVVAMAIATTAIGLLPGYATIGVLAPVLLVVCRLAQGFFAGGEFGGAVTLATEYAPADRRGYLGSWQQFSTGAGLLAGSALGALLIAILGTDVLVSWAWRIPFLIAAPLGLIGLYLRLHLEDTPAFVELREAENVSRAPVVELFRSHGRSLLVAMGATLPLAVGAFLLLIYLPTYLSSVLGVTAARSFSTNLAAIAVYIAAIPFAGLLSDRIGRVRVLLVGAVGFLLLTYPAFLLLGTRAVSGLLAGQILLGLLLAAIAGPTPAWWSELFPTHVRYSALSLANALVVTIFGGFAPFIATALIRGTGDQLAPAYYVIGGALVSTVVLLNHSRGRFLR